MQRRGPFCSSTRLLECIHQFRGQRVSREPKLHQHERFQTRGSDWVATHVRSVTTNRTFAGLTRVPRDSSTSSFSSFPPYCLPSPSSSPLVSISLLPIHPWWKYIRLPHPLTSPASSPFPSSRHPCWEYSDVPIIFPLTFLPSFSLLSTS